MQRLFVYGTLRHGRAKRELADLLRGARTLGEASVPGRLYDLGAYPGALPPDAGPVQGRVHGEVLEIPGDEAALARLDAYEGFTPDAPATSLFVRERTTATLSSGSVVDCWIYRYARTPPSCARIEGGRWTPGSGRGG